MSYIIIPIDERTKDKELHLITNNNTAYITSIDLISQLLRIDEYPIKNKKLAIKNILQFLSWLDNQNPKDDKYSIHSRTLSGFFNSKRYKKYLKILKDLQVLNNVPLVDGDGKTRIKDGKVIFYEEGVVSQQFVLFHKYKVAELCLVILENDNLEKTKVITDDGSYCKKMIDTIKHTTIDYKSAITDEINNHLVNNTTTNSLRIKLNKILSLNSPTRSIRKGVKVNRVYHTLSNLSRIARPYLTVKGKEFFDIDIKNCQPLLLCYLFKKRNMNYDTSYINDCENAVIYERFVNQNRNRDEAKVELYKSIFFGFNISSQINKDFKELYPLTWQSLKDLHKCKGDSLARILQNIEADIFNRISVDSRYYYTLFDAVYYTDSNDYDKIRNQIESAFNQFGLLPKFSNKKLND